MKLYIPTSSLNADMILSCESILPTSECRKREFGYTNFEVLEELRGFEIATIAFSKIPVFTINDYDRENYPLIVEVALDDGEYGKLVPLAVVEDTEIFAVANPVHISPATARLLFFDERALEYTFHNCSDSAKCKLFNLFQSRFDLAEKQLLGSYLSNYVSKIKLPTDIRPTYSENNFDKAKGFIWGYAIGCLLSMPHNVANLLKIQKRIYDIISSSKNDGFMLPAFKNELIKLDEEYKNNDPTTHIAKVRWAEHIMKMAHQFDGITIDKIDDFDSILRELRIESIAKDLFLKEQGLSLLKTLKDYRYSYDIYNTDVCNHTQKIIYQNRKEQYSSIKIERELGVDTDKYESVMLYGADEKSVMFNKILRKMIWDRVILSLEQLRVNRAEISKEMVIILKTIIEDMGQPWVDTKTKTYFNAMRRNFIEGAPFNLKDVDNPVFQGLAAFICKGEDFDSLRSYLETSAVPDCRYAFALWGALMGYVSIPRALFESILSEKQIVGLSTRVNRMLGICEPEYTFSERFYEPKSLEMSKTEVSMSGGDKIPSLGESIREFFLTYIMPAIKVENKRKASEAELDLALQHFGDGDSAYMFVTHLSDYTHWSYNTKAWKALKDKFCPDYKSPRKTVSSKKHLKNSKQKKDIQQLEFDFETDEDKSGLSGTHTYPDFPIQGNLSYNYNNEEQLYSSKNVSIRFTSQFTKEIQDLIIALNPGLNYFAAKHILNDLNWIFDPQYSKDKTESELLDQFYKILMSGKYDKVSRKGTSMAWKNEAYRLLDIDKTISALKIKCNL